ncbi:hypothetical protein [Capnocytophaga gingivalis]|uniref:Immunity protein 63 domain-containing protein n=1 Tax=Capnocytophaga gingivalis TaxID=1017 RepID=A0ABU5Z8K1_9FLAO|nr:hypothetical protein [Capnocytophaga gingivalis]MEB3074994.1 hypothetical protein [Capnocytophaga gingivalis]
MKKTASQIEADLYKYFKDKINPLINGQTYRSGVRPLNSQKEDCVISFLTGLDGQYQTGVVNINIFIPMVKNNDNQYMKDFVRCEAIEQALMPIIEEAETDLRNYRLQLHQMIQTFEETDIKQFFINAKIKFRYNTFNN